jgi:regulator of protease activity HflC (stomatin/prohibitin superfamily)
MLADIPKSLKKALKREIEHERELLADIAEAEAAGKRGFGRD